MIYLQLFWEFFKTGLFAVGGGMATVPFLFRMGQNTGWFDANTLTDMIAVSESTPGPIGVNMATYVGNRTAGPLGGLVATLGLVAPCIIIILIICKVLMKYMKHPVVEAVFRILRAVVIGLLAYAFWQVASVSLIGVKEYILFAVFIALIVCFKKVHPIVFIILGAAAGLFIP